jgi:hypothetical protein
LDCAHRDGAVSRTSTKRQRVGRGFSPELTRWRFVLVEARAQPICEALEGRFRVPLVVLDQCVRPSRIGTGRVRPVAPKIRWRSVRSLEIVVNELAIEELESLRAFDQRRILADIREQLADQPGVPTRRRKCLIDLTPSFEHESPVWELRVGAFRVFLRCGGGG